MRSSSGGESRTELGELKREAGIRKHSKCTSRVAKSKHVKDCQRYRDKMSRKFDELAKVIHGASVDGSGNNRAKMIDHTLVVLNRLLNETKDLQLQLAMTDKRRMSKWVERVVSEANDVEGAATPLMDLLVNKRDWKYAEFWSVEKVQGSPTSVLELRTHLYHNKLSSTEFDLFEGLQRKHSEEKVQPESGLLKKTLEAMRGQYMELTTSGQAQVELRSCLTVPVVVLGHVRGIAVFYNSVWDKNEAEEGLKFAEEVANVVGNAYGGRCREKAVQQQKKKPDSLGALSSMSSSSSSNSLSWRRVEPRGSISFLLNAGS